MTGLRTPWNPTFFPPLKSLPRQPASRRPARRPRPRHRPTLSSRFAEWSRTASDDGWHENRPEAPATQVFVDSAKTVISHNDAPDLPFDQSLNPLSRLRARLHLLLCPPQPRLSRPLAGLDFETPIYH